jgi:iron complex outermembrane receptor protein
MIGMFLFAMITVQQDTGTATLPTVKVTVSRDAARSALELPYAVTRFVPDSLRPGLRNASVDERLFLLPGVVISNRNNPTQDPRVSIRGFGSRSAFGVRGVRVQMDGVPLTLPDGQTPLDYLDLESVGRLELIRGSASSLYGNAGGGVIDLRSRAVAAAPLDPAVNIWMGSDEQRKIALSLGGTGGDTQYALSVSRMATNGFREHAEQRITNGSLRVATQLGAFRIGAGLLAHDMPLAQNPGALTLAEMTADIRDAEALAVTRKARKEVSQVQAGLTIGTGSAVEPGTFESELVLHGGARDLNNPLQFAVVNVERATHGASLRGTAALRFLGRPSRLTAGVDYQKQDDDRREYTNCNGVTAVSATCPVLGVERGSLRRTQTELVTGFGPYLRGEIQLTEKFLLSAGARADVIRFELRDSLVNANNPDDSGERTLRAVSPMAGLVWRAAPLRSAYLTFSTAFETPTATELGNKPDGSAGFNPELDPQRSSTIEAGSRGWVNFPLPGGLSYDLAVYRTTVSDELIPFEIEGGAGRRFFRNAGSTVRTGFEMSLATGVGPATFNLAYGYSHFRFDEYVVDETNFGDNRIPGIPIQQLQGAVSLRTGPWYATLEGETRGSVFVDDANTTRSAGFEVMNIRFGGQGVAGLRWFSPRLGVMNVFDRHYAASVSVNASGGRYYEPAQGRTFYAGITLGGFR